MWQRAPVSPTWTKRLDVKPEPVKLLRTLILRHIHLSKAKQKSRWSFAESSTRVQTARFSSILLSLFPLQIKTGQLLRSGLDDIAVKSAGAAERPPLPRTWLPVGPQTASSASCAEVSCWSQLVSSLLSFASSIKRAFGRMWHEHFQFCHLCMLWDVHVIGGNLWLFDNVDSDKTNACILMF